MALYRATSKLVNRITTGRIGARAFVVNIDSDNATPGTPGVTGHIDGLTFRDQIDPSARSFTMPASLAPSGEAFTGFSTQARVRCEIQDASGISDQGGSGTGPLKGRIFMNRYFEADFPTGTSAAWIAYLVSNGWFATAGSLVDSNVPAALNVGLPQLTAREAGV